VANPVKFSASAVAYRHAAPALGQHTREVLCGLLRMDEARVQALAARGVLGAR